ncbi:MAG: bifunctional riboflavin kinase/FAD synthetase [Deltaproteobacteria bacterium]|nr:bifunctional riboflavin kinase/FAD synthetase [Candidatus Zymogenaceae bacterium]
MHIINWHRDYRAPFDRTVLAIGNFDGVHRGHTAILERVVDRAEREDAQPAILTFHPHPRKIFTGEEPLLITDFDEKMHLIEQQGISAVFVVGEDRTFYRMSPREFSRRVLRESLSVVHVFVGYDFSFGKNRIGDIDDLNVQGKKLGFAVEKVEEVTLDGMPVSSTEIRRLIGDGAVDRAAQLLGREYTMRGEVIHGMDRGRSLLGFPTANVDFTTRLVPADGVYAVRVIRDGMEYPAVANLGNNPTFSDVGLSLEVFILDFVEDLYGEVIEVSFVRRIRGERAFSGPEELIARIVMDVREAREILGS